MLGALLAVQFSFASLSIVGKVTVAVVPWRALVLLRCLGGLAVFVGLALLRGEAILPPAHLRRRVLLLGFLGVFANQAGFLAGLRRTSAINATVLVATIPLFTALFSVVTRREPPRARFALGTLVAFGGLLLVVRPERMSLGADHLVGDALIVFNSLVYGVYLALARDLVLEHGGAAVVRWAFLAGTLLALPVGLIPLVTAVPSFGPRIIAALAYVLLVPTAFAYATNAWALQRVPASVVSVFIYLQPVIATALALTVGAPLAAWLSVAVTTEALTLRTALGGVTVLAGVALATLRRPKR